MQTSGRGGLLNRRFGLQNPPTLVATLSGDRPVTFAHLRVESGGQALASIPPDTAYSIHLHLRQTTLFDIRERRRITRKECVKGGSVCFFDLQSPPDIFFDTPLHTIRSYVPLLALQESAQEAGGRRQVVLRPPSCGVVDPILRHLLACLHPALEHPEKVSSLFVDHIALALQAHLLQTYATRVVMLPAPRRRLAPWQERRAKEVMDASLDKDISIAQLARECGLSSSHFTRAFRQTTGRPPYRWFLERRVETAQSLLLNSQMSLQEIASACGFADQSDLTRAFTRIVGTSPGAWRRARRG
jgi:AraC family transcriptional regulator